MIATVFKGVDNRMKSGYLLRDVVNKVASIHFTSSEELHTLGSLYESMLREMRDTAGDSGELYTPRPVVRFMAEGNGFPYRVDDQVIREPQEAINQRQAEYRRLGFERQTRTEAGLDDLDLDLVPQLLGRAPLAGRPIPEILMAYGLATPRRDGIAVTNSALRELRRLVDEGYLVLEGERRGLLTWPAPSSGCELDSARYAVPYARALLRQGRRGRGDRSLEPFAIRGGPTYPNSNRYGTAGREWRCEHRVTCHPPGRLRR